MKSNHIFKIKGVYPTDRSGFTLVELIVVIVIVLVLGATAAPRIMQYVSKAQEAMCVQNRRALYSEMSAACAEAIVRGDDTTMQAIFESLGERAQACPNGGEYTFKASEENSYEGEIVCSLHSETEESGEGTDGEVGGGSDGGANGGTGVGTLVGEKPSNIDGTSPVMQVYDVFAGNWTENTVSSGGENKQVYTKTIDGYILIYERETITNADVVKYAQQQGKTPIVINSDGKPDSDARESLAALIKNKNGYSDCSVEEVTFDTDTQKLKYVKIKYKNSETEDWTTVEYDY